MMADAYVLLVAPLTLLAIAMVMLGGRMGPESRPVKARARRDQIRR